MGALPLHGRKDNLPADATSFVGRKRDVGEVRRLLSSARLITLTGVGGVGKTRLAVHVASELRRAFRDGVWLVELADVSDSDLVVHTFCESLGIHDDSGRDHRKVLADYLRDRQVLVVLDNCEHLVEACAELVDVLLRAAAGLHVVATSRQRLGITAEHVWSVSPLPLPEPERALPADTYSTYPALTLFADRAAAVDPDFAITPENQNEIAQMCHLLGGIPLAIELAAAWLRGLTTSQLLSRLDETDHLLAASRRGGAARHQTLQAAMCWSFELCTRAEQVLWAHASVFAGTFDLDAVQSVCTRNEVSAEDVVGVVAGLVDKSVLTREQHGRYRLLEPLRQFGLGKLRELGLETELRQRHRDHFLALVSRSEQNWFGPDQPRIFARTRAEHANLRSALEFCLGGDSVLAGLRLAGALWFYWAGCGVIAEGRHWLDRALAASSEPNPEWAKVLWVNGFVSMLQGDLTIAERRLEECVRYSTGVGDDVAVAHAAYVLGCVAVLGSDIELAVARFEHARALFRERGLVNSCSMNADIGLARAMMSQGDLDWAEALCEGVRAVGEAHEERWAFSYAILVLALIRWQRGDVELAGAFSQECLRIKRMFNDLRGIVVAMEVLAWVAAAHGEAVRAATLLGATEQIWRAVGTPMFGSSPDSDPHRDCGNKAVEALGEAAFRRTFETGVDFSLDEAISYALGDEQPPPAETPSDETPLTPREEEVADLVAQGMSNKEIAARLVISRRTADGHVERILHKLGFTSRTQIATWITKRTELVQQLSGREQQVLGLLATGRTHQQIATALSVAVSSVDTYVKRIRQKTKLGNKAELTCYAHQAGLVTPDVKESAAAREAPHKPLARF